MSRDLHSAVVRHLKGEVDQAMQELRIAESEDSGKPHSIDHAVKSRTISQKRVAVDASLARLELFESFPATRMRNGLVAIRVQDREARKMVDRLLREVDGRPEAPLDSEYAQTEKGSTAWVSRLENSLAPHVDHLSVRSVSPDSVTFHVDDISDTESIRGIAKSFDVDIHLFAKNGLMFTAWARR